MPPSSASVYYGILREGERNRETSFQIFFPISERDEHQMRDLVHKKKYCGVGATVGHSETRGQWPDRPALIRAMRI